MYPPCFAVYIALGRMKQVRCPTCREMLPPDAFRKSGKGACKWCEWESSEKRAHARFGDKLRADKVARRASVQNGTEFSPRLAIDEAAFVAWYCAQPDCCHYCRLTMLEVKKLRLRRGGFGYFVSWDIDRVDSSKPYEAGNLALSCFVCNMAKGNLFTAAEARLLGKTVSKVFKQRLRAPANAA